MLAVSSHAVRGRSMALEKLRLDYPLLVPPWWHPVRHDRRTCENHAQRASFIYFVDWNEPFHVIQSQPWLPMLKAVALAPAGGTITCWQGQGTDIDFAHNL